MKQSSVIKTVLFTLTALLLFAPMAQERFKVFSFKPLEEESGAAPKPNLTFKSYRTAQYQTQLESYVGEHFGFREPLIRTYNQFVYSGLHSITNQHIKRGLNDELYLKMYLDEASGNTLVKTYFNVENAKAAAQYNVDETLRLIDTLHSHGTEFLFIFAPTKTAVYPEQMPHYYRNHIQEFSLEEYYIELFKEKGIPHIDFLSQFKAMRDTVTYPLYTRTGTHWAASTLPFVTDSIMRKIASITGYDLPRICCLNAPLTTDYTEQDAELEVKMNLLWPLEKPALPRPEITLCDTAGKVRPNLLAVGDSHFGTLIGTGFTEAFAHWDFWEYNKTSISSNPVYNFAQVSELADAYKILEDADIMMAVFTAPMLYNYMFGFTDSAFGLYEYARCDSCKREGRIRWLMHSITSDPDWFDAVVKQAEEKGISVEQALRGNAEYLIYVEEQGEN